MILGSTRLFLAVTMVILSIPTPTARAQRPDVYSGADNARRLVVRITGDGIEGAGVIYHVDERYAYGVTARHVLLDRTRRPRKLIAQLEPWLAKLPLEHIRFDPKRDLGTFRLILDDLGVSPAEVAQTLPFDILGNAADLERGDGLYTVGHASGGAWIVPNHPLPFAGVASSTPAGEIDALRIEHTCHGGHSGGGVFDDRWRLVGMMIHDKPPFCEALRMDWILHRLHEWREDVRLRPAVRQTTAAARPERRDIVVAVVDFDNRSGEPLPRFGLMAHEVLSRYLYNVPGVTLVTRDRLDRVIAEQGAVGVVSDEAVNHAREASQIGQILKADALVLGSVIQFDVERRRFRGGRAFGNASAAIDVYRMEISLQLLDVATGRVRFAKTYDTEARNEYAQASSAPPRPVARQSELLRMLVEKAGPELRRALGEVAQGLGYAGQLVQVPVTTRPAGASVTIDGIYVGATPLSLDLATGLQDIAITLPGHAEWRHRVKIEPGTEIDIALVPQARRGDR